MTRYPAVVVLAVLSVVNFAVGDAVNTDHATRASTTKSKGGERHPPACLTTPTLTPAPTTTAPTPSSSTPTMPTPTTPTPSTPTPTTPTPSTPTPSTPTPTTPEPTTPTPTTPEPTTPEPTTPEPTAAAPVYSVTIIDDRGRTSTVGIQEGVCVSLDFCLLGSITHATSSNVGYAKGNVVSLFSDNHCADWFVTTREPIWSYDWTNSDARTTPRSIVIAPLDAQVVVPVVEACTVVPFT